MIGRGREIAVGDLSMQNIRESAYRYTKVRTKLILPTYCLCSFEIHRDKLLQTYLVVFCVVHGYIFSTMDPCVVW